VVCEIFLGAPRGDDRVIGGANYLTGYRPDPQSSVLPLYHLYYGTLANFNVGGEYWTGWNRLLQPTLLGRQIQDGLQAGSWAPEATDYGHGTGGRVYATALAALCLEVYYRYLPMYGAGQ
jgi:hypothetical protein